MTARRVVFPGRFQPFHRGHHRVVSARRDGEFVLALGSPRKSRTAENPLSATEREAVIRACFPDLSLVRVADEDRGEAGYEAWAHRLVDTADADVVLSQNPLVKRLVRDHTGAAVEGQELHAPERFSGTNVRRRIRGGAPWRELVPECARERIADYGEVIARTG